MLKLLFIYSMFTWLIGIVLPSHATVSDYLKRIEHDPNALYAFFKIMPKGGELHYHLAGSAYPEAMLTEATKTFCINAKTHAVQNVTPCEDITSATLMDNPQRYDDVVRAWSMKDFIAGKESAHDHFFNSFAKFMPLFSGIQPQLLAGVMKRAANQHELYLEVMILPDNAVSSSFGSRISGPLGFAAKQRLLLADPHFQNNITHTKEESDRLLKNARSILGCDTLPEQKVCHLAVAFQYHILREQPLDNFFAQALNAFAASATSSTLVGINLVQPEDGIIALRDYKEQMRILKFLNKSYPNVAIALHAGELSPKSVPPEALRFHIHDAIMIGKASRIGHGVAIAYEDKAPETLSYMAKNPVPVEINLTSNETILGISGKDHPIIYYLKHHVPIVLSTDDEGILRTDLTREYVKAAEEYHLDYATIKTINRNALTYSFLPGNSLWQDAEKAIPVKACQTLNSASCQDFVKHNEKAQRQWQLEQELNAFEASF